MTVSLSLSFKIIIILVVSLTVVLIGSTYLNIQTQRWHLTQAVQISAERASDFAKKALRHGMEVNNRPDIWRTITDLGVEPGIERIRIYDKKGVIRYSTLAAEVGRTVNISTDACIMCHGSSTEFIRTRSNQFMRLYEGPHGHRILGFINPIRNERSCWMADCHAHTSDQTVLGVLDVQMSLQDVDDHITSNINQLVLTTMLSIFAVALVSGLFVYAGVHKPVKRFIAGTKQIAAGNLQHRIAVDRRDELGDLAASFNHMASDLDTAQHELIEWSNTLERKVKQKTRELQTAQEQVLHMEKMASLGKLSSMIAHELNNPLSGILTLAKLVKKRLGAPEILPEKLEQMNRDLSIISDEAKRCGEIVKNLLFFARAHPSARASCDLQIIIERSLRLIQHQIDMQQIVAQVVPPETPVLVDCDESQIQQVLIAILINALEAMPDGGTLTLATRTVESTGELTISDTGIGIPSAELSKIFEPFYTTKESGYGMGLGLSIVYGIIKQHNGDISVTSEPGHGTVITILLPSASRTFPTPSDEAKA